ncbi:MAG: transcription-repair coupling factor, partial [Bacteroidetes bacterium]|nr:transcription-repair coupling factor [Bacteroidota bacterium]
MNLSSIIDSNFHCEQNRNLNSFVQTENYDVAHLNGLVGSAISFILASLQKETERNQLLVVNDKEQAAYILNDLENLVGEKASVLFFPQSYRRPYEIADIDNANILMRAQVLNNLLNSTKKSIIITYPEALAEKVVTKSHLSKNTLELKKQDKVSISFITDVLFEYGFERNDYVYEPGQFAIRGGIIDIFSFANEDPFRIEMYGENINSIRTFDAANQLSIQELNQIIIIPNVQDKLLTESRQSFFQYITNSTVLWFENVQLCEEKLEKELAVAEKAYSQLSGEIERLAPQEMYWPKEEFLNECLSFKRIEYSTQKYWKPNQTIEYSYIPQPSFNKNFDLLIANLKDNVSKGYRNIIFSDTQKQMERLNAIFEDIIAKSATESILNANWQDFFTTINTSIHEGFIDKNLKLACYTDHQIFERYHRFKLKNSFSKKNEAITVKELKNLNPGDYVTHIDHGIGRFGGLEIIDINGKQQETIRIVYKDNDVLYIPIHSLHKIAKHS